MNAIDQKQDELIRMLNELGDGFEQYSCLIEQSFLLPAMPESEKSESNLVKDCQSKVWLSLSARDGLLCFSADSDTLILRGVLELLREILSGQPLDLVANTPIRLFSETELLLSFDSVRQGGIGTIIRMIQSYAQNRCLAPLRKC